MSANTMDRLVYMANQIGKFFEPQGHERAVKGVAKHVKDFWDPRMRARMEDHIAAGGAGLMPTVFEALKTLPPVSRDTIPAPHPTLNPPGPTASHH
ncbi:formate dehydrogenase subunit delta [Ancylobacter mangrovi]|uniref:Formate dehydrogenase subunit delta n=1 Tax=Ancylobacter mangrovi TaxID=2972472 RepID=A0A9X2PFK2_9HYPH|nr:formate dehydrogenase subunit delta [Ancylobacter mangrovi]MCS0495090.1 formate dehydrogenase subunit delta [Ancylobacter mangrovi]MCS0502484.1 formate dehydrogenase subunit delta [Ancylobacter mangrovi]